MKGIAHISLILACCLLPLSSQADEVSSVYFGVGLNATRFSPSTSDLSASYPSLSPSSELNTTSYNLAGYVGYNFDSFLGAELDLIAGGSVSADTAGQQVKLFDVSLLTISAVFNHQLSDRVNLFGKLGGTAWGFTQTNSTANSPENSGVSPSIGLGMDINLYGGKERQMRIEWMRTNFNNGILSNANCFTISGLFSFR